LKTILKFIKSGFTIYAQNGEIYQHVCSYTAEMLIETRIRRD